MATQPNTPRKDLVQCPFCGEDYSVTYRKCPFCDDQAGRRPSTPPRPRVDDSGKECPPHTGIEPVRIVGYALGLILIVAAIYIVCSMLAPLFGGNTPAASESTSQSSASTSASASQSTPDVSTPDASTPDVSTPDVSTPDVSVPDVSTPDVSTPDPTPTTPAAPVASGTMAVINSGNVNIRETAGSGNPLDSSTEGAEVIILETANVDGHTWYKIRYNVGGGKTRDGFIRSDFVDIKTN